LLLQRTNRSDAADGELIIPAATLERLDGVAQTAGGRLMNCALVFERRRVFFALRDDRDQRVALLLQVRRFRSGPRDRFSLPEGLNDEEHAAENDADGDGDNRPTA